MYVSQNCWLNPLRLLNFTPHFDRTRHPVNNSSYAVMRVGRIACVGKNRRSVQSSEVLQCRNNPRGEKKINYMIGIVSPTRSLNSFEYLVWVDPKFKGHAGNAAA